MNKKNKEIEKQIQKTLKKIFEKTVNSASEFREEFEKQVVIAVTSAFGFLVALFWKEPITELVNNILKNLPQSTQITFKFISAIIVTTIATFVLILLAKMRSKHLKT